MASLKQYNEVEGLCFPMKALLEEGALVSGGGLFCLWSFLLGVLVLVWYRERMVQVCWVRCYCVGHNSAYTLVLGWFLARVPAVLRLVDLFLLAFSRIDIGYVCKSAVSSCVRLSCCMCCPLFGFENPVCGLCFRG